MEEEEIEKAVLAYLKKKGFKQTELAFHEEHQNQQTKNSSFNSQADPDVAKLILSFSSDLENISAKIHEGYSKLRSWTYSSLDLYKHELLRVLYPVFVPCFMDLIAKGHLQEAHTFFNMFCEDHETMHLRDLQKLGVLSPSHLEEMEFAHSLRQSKVNIKICQYSYDLLLQYLHNSQSITMLGIINEHINFQVAPGQPGSITDDAEAVTLVDSGQEVAGLINQKEIHWGLLEDSMDYHLEKAASLLSDSGKQDGETKDRETEETKKKAGDAGKQGASIKKAKKDKVSTGTGKSTHPESHNTLSMAPRFKAELPFPIISAEVELSILEDLRNRVQLSSTSLPSVCFYTFIKAHSSLNCASISHDGSLVVGGFSDSSLKVWDMAKLGQQTGSSGLQGENETSASEPMFGANAGKKPCNLFQGHSGPVYSASFSPVGDFILSSSSDSTGMIT